MGGIVCMSCFYFPEEYGSALERVMQLWLLWGPRVAGFTLIIAACLVIVVLLVILLLTTRRSGGGNPDV